MHKFNQNYLHTLLLITGLLSILAFIGYIIAGSIGAIWALSMGFFSFLFIPKISPHFILKMYGARLLPIQQARTVHMILNKLVVRSELSYTPEIFYIPSSSLMAFSIGRTSNAAIALSDGLLRQLNERELNTVLAHELSHIVNKDIMVMSLADVITRITSLLALFGYILLLINIPVLILNNGTVPWLLLIILVTAPNISAILQLALSRTREYNADHYAARLTGDPIALISALEKIEYHQNGWLERIVLPGFRIPVPSLLRTHPNTKDRIALLKQLTIEMNNTTKLHQTPMVNQQWLDFPDSTGHARRRFNGLWY